jgi:hypothetical protein
MPSLYSLGVGPIGDLAEKSSDIKVKFRSLQDFNFLSSFGYGILFQFGKEHFPEKTAGFLRGEHND